MENDNIYKLELNSYDLKLIKKAIDIYIASGSWSPSEKMALINLKTYIPF